MGLCGLTTSFIIFSILHFGAFAFAITVCGLYGVDLQKASSAGKAPDGRWVYAEVVGGLSAITAALYFIPFILRFAVIWIWNALLFILWITLFGLFGSMYIKERPEGNADIQRMKDAVWIDLTNALLWLVIALASFVYWWRHRERNTRFTGRARV